MANATYAEVHSLDIVRTYTDAAISGLRLANRFGLQRLLADVISGEATFSTILVYDVSRWGRFQDPDESAHYEFLCRSAGVSVEYTGEQFADDGSIGSVLLKSVKRVMAAEYSRELSAKISLTQRGLAAKGYWMGGREGLGMRRQPVRANGQRRAILNPGERHGIEGERTVLVAGPPEEAEVIRRIYKYFLSGISSVRVAKKLNDEGVPAPRGGRWAPNTVREILRNEKYAGVVVSGRFRSRLGVHDRRPRHEWIRAEGACEPIISEQTFARAQRKFKKCLRGFSDEELLACLASLFRREGRLSHSLMRADRSMPCADVFINRFGSMAAAYDRVGYSMTDTQRRASQKMLAGLAGRALGKRRRAMLAEPRE